jgi:hypothetical protein
LLHPEKYLDEPSFSRPHSPLHILLTGNESFKQGVNIIRKGYKDDLHGVLPVFTWDDENLPDQQQVI